MDKKLTEVLEEKVKSDEIRSKLQSQIFEDSDVQEEEKITTSSSTKNSHMNSVKVESEKPLLQMPSIAQKVAKEPAQTPKNGSQRLTTSTSSRGSSPLQTSSKVIQQTTPSTTVPSPTKSSTTKSSPTKSTAIKPLATKSVAIKAPTAKSVAPKSPAIKPDDSVLKSSLKLPKIISGSPALATTIPSTFTGDDEDDYFHGFIFFYSVFHFSFCNLIDLWENNDPCVYTERYHLISNH